MPERELDVPMTNKLEAAKPVELLEKKPDEVKQPPTPAELLEEKLAALKSENDDARAERRAAELKQHLDVHQENIATSNAMYLVPEGVPFNLLSPEQAETWNKRRVNIDQANRAYHLACQRTHTEHRQEDQHIAKLLVEAASNA